MEKPLLIIIVLILFFLPATVNAQSDLVGYWSFDDCTAKDSSGYGNNGTIYGATCVDGRVGNALEFDGVDDYIEIPHSNSVSGFTNGLTVSFWIKSDNTTRRQAILNKYNNVNGQKGWFIDAPSYTGNDLGFYASQDGTNYSEWHANYAPKVGEWYHVAVVWETNKQSKFYVNGQPIGTTSSTIITQIYNNIGVPLLIGKSQYDSTRYFDGTIDEIRIYNRALTTQEIYSDYLKGVKYILSGQLKHKNNTPVRARISFLNHETGALITTNQTDENGNYFLSEYTGIYDLLYEMIDSNFSIKLNSFNFSKNYVGVLNYLSFFENKISFEILMEKELSVQLYSDKTPKKILINGSEIENVNSLQELKNNSWFYNSTEKIIHLKSILDCNFLCKIKGFSSGLCRYTGEDLPRPSPLNLSEAIATLRRDSNVTWHTHEVLIDLFKNLSDAHPKYASYESIGKTHQGRDIMIFKIGNPEGGRVMWDGCIHGPEDMGSEIMYIFAKWLLESGNETANKILQRNYVLFVPVINMDSYARQNKNFSACQYGVDLNRNFVVGWRSRACTIGNCTNTTECQSAYGSSYVCRNGSCVNNYDYSGAAPASENETKAMRNAFQKYKPNFYVNTHYGGGPWLGYYSGNNMTLVNIVLQRINEISSQMGVTPYPVQSVGSNGMAVGDANYFGANAWLFEVEAWPPTGHHSYDDVVNIYFPKSLPILIAMCEASEVTPQINVCQSGETYIGQDHCSSDWVCCCLS